MEKFFKNLRFFLEKIDHYRDELLFLFIRPYWPHIITPNLITYARVLLGIFLFVMLFFFGIKEKVLIISLFCIGAVTDLLDGSVARGLNKTTEFGAMLDTIADRILILPIAVYSLYESEKWLLFFLILAEVANALAAAFYKSKEVYKANIFGKTKMVLVCIVLAVILLVWPSPAPTFFIDALWASLFFTFLSILTRITDLSQGGFIKSKIITKQLNKF